MMHNLCVENSSVLAIFVFSHYLLLAIGFACTDSNRGLATIEETSSVVNGITCYIYIYIYIYTMYIYRFH